MTIWFVAAAVVLINVADIGSLVSAGLKIIDGNKPKAS